MTTDVITLKFELDRRHGQSFHESLVNALNLLANGIEEHDGIKRRGECSFTMSAMKLRWEMTEEETRQ